MFNIIREIKTKTTMREHMIPTRMAIMKQNKVLETHKC